MPQHVRPHSSKAVEAKDSRVAAINNSKAQARKRRETVRNLFEKAQRTKGVTGEVLLQLLESRLDNVVYRLGIAKTRAAARQLVSHRHITVDGQVVNIPSYTLKPGQVVGVREKAKSLEVITDSLAGRSHSSYSWLEWNQASLSGKFLSAPQREDIPEEIKEQLIVELYSK